MTKTQLNAAIRAIYERLIRAYGPQNWWPVSLDDTSSQSVDAQIVVGAILTQNTAWANVERAIAQLGHARRLSWAALRDISQEGLARLIRPAGTYRVKAGRIKAFVDYLWQHYDGRFDDLVSGDLDTCRRRLLSIHGIGRETADAILLYAAGRPSFVVDAYTRRILRRHLLIEGRASYDEVQRRFCMAMPADPGLYNEYHALLVEVGKRHCKPRPRCDGCPLSDMPHEAVD